MKHIVWSALALILVAAPLAAQGKGTPEEQEGEHVPTPAAPYARWLVSRTTAAHEQIEAVEIAVVHDGVCSTIASSDPEDVGEKCDDDETEPMKTGKVSVEAPSAAEATYDVTQPLHDAAGNLIGTVGMDIESGSMTREAVLGLALAARKEIEALIPSKEKLFGPAPRG